MLPSVSDMVDYEGELALVIGPRCQHVPAARAFEVVAGFTIINDVSARDWQWRTPTFTMGKSFDTHAPCGPELVTGDELGDPGSLAIRTWVNDELRQDSTTADLIFGCADMIEYLTTAFPLEPGTIIATGTPAGVGAGFDPPRFLAAGDTVRIGIEGIGELSNPVVQGGSARARRARLRLSLGLERQARRRRRPGLAMTWRAKVGVSPTRNRNRCLSMTASMESSTATAVALRGDASTIAISPKVSSGPMSKACPLGRRSSTCPETTPNISSPTEPSSKITVPAGMSLVSLAPLKTPRTFTLIACPLCSLRWRRPRPPAFGILNDPLPADRPVTGRPGCVTRRRCTGSPGHGRMGG